MFLRCVWSCLFTVAVCLHCSAQSVSRYSVIIDELLADPSPPIGLPNAEFIELKNISAFSIDLFNWTITDASGRAAIVDTHFYLKPDSFLVLCNISAFETYQAIAPTIGLANFPSLNNAGDTLMLRSPDGNLVHLIYYDKSSYSDNDKADGGWSLEMINTGMPCAGSSNWKASVDPKGGTPGSINSVNDNAFEQGAISLLRSYTIDSTTIVAVFDKSPDSASAAQQANYNLDHSIGNPFLATASNSASNEIVLKLATPLKKDSVYTLSVQHITDCAGNEVENSNTAKAGMPAIPDTGDVVINELLFNPRPDGVDFVELLNRGKRIIDLRDLFVANRNGGGEITALKRIALTPFLFFPGDYMAMSENILSTKKDYVVKNPIQLIEIASLPSMPDDDGDIIIATNDSVIIDELHYDHNWHLGLISNESGISIERISANDSTQSPKNWMSAAASAGYGTPTYQNSACPSSDIHTASLIVTPKVFSPDHDGRDDICMLNFQVGTAGYVAAVNIFNAHGSPVRYLVKNATIGLSGTFQWDGLDDRGSPVPIGTYIIITDLFNLTGEVREYKNAVTIVHKL